MKKKNRSFIKFDINYPGVYEFSFESYKVSSISKFQYLHTYNLIIIDYYQKPEIKITFATSVNDEKNKVIDTTHVSTLEEQLNKSIKLVKDVHFNQQMVTRKMTTHYKAAKSHNNKLRIMSIVETFVMILILVGQTLYLKNLINKM